MATRAEAPVNNTDTVSAVIALNTEANVLETRDNPTLTVSDISLHLNSLRNDLKNEIARNDDRDATMHILFSFLDVKALDEIKASHDIHNNGMLRKCVAFAENLRAAQELNSNHKVERTAPAIVNSANAPAIVNSANTTRTTGVSQGQGRETTSYAAVVNSQGTRTTAISNTQTTNAAATQGGALDKMVDREILNREIGVMGHFTNILKMYMQIGEKI